ncbi:hypothetical protein Glaag_3254 [Glaciecola sp. 4H-3-7+YE-5]|nr:hypothetical protein Glaag_3254 [Glaciecola sp. 4H-3-7+YE-5]
MKQTVGGVKTAFLPFTQVRAAEKNQIEKEWKLLAALT